MYAIAFRNNAPVYLAKCRGVDLKLCGACGVVCESSHVVDFCPRFMLLRKTLRERVCYPTGTSLFVLSESEDYATFCDYSI
jgi:hypothetical protein